MLKTGALIFAAATFSMTFITATPADAAETARQGIARCGGNHFLRQSGTEIRQNFYTMRNVDSTQPITITRMVAFAATGATLYDSAVSGFPVTSNGIISPTNSTINPRQSANIGTGDILPAFLAQTERPISVVIAWSAPAPALVLAVSSSSVVRERDAVNGNELAERSRSSGKCDTTLIP